MHAKYELIDRENPNVFDFTSTSAKEKVLVLLNFSKEISTIEVPKVYSLTDEMMNNLQPLKFEGSTIKLVPYQACIVKMK